MTDGLSNVTESLKLSITISLSHIFEKDWSVANNMLIEKLSSEGDDREKNLRDENEKNLKKVNHKENLTKKKEGGMPRKSWQAVGGSTYMKTLRNFDRTIGQHWKESLCMILIEKTQPATKSYHTESSLISV